MGHIRVGRLPRTKTWQGVFQVLEDKSISPERVAQVTVLAAQNRLIQLEHDRQINFCFWVLTQVATAAKGNDFAEKLKNLGAKPEKITSGLSFIQQISQVVETRFNESGQTSVFSSFALASLKETLTRNVVAQSGSLFGSDIDSVKKACTAFSSREKFGNVAKQFYAGFLGRVVKFLVDKELSNYIGPTKAIEKSDQSLRLHSGIDQHCLETAKIVEDFASGWFSKNNWETGNQISEEATLGFTAYALEKIRIALQEGHR